MRAVFVFAAVLAVFAAVHASDIPFKSCATGPTKASLKSLTQLPSKAVEGTNTTITYAFTLDEQVTSGDYTLTISLFGVKVVDHSGDICSSDVIPLPIPKGLDLVMAGLSCPAAAGDYNLTSVMTTATVAPPSGDFTIEFSATDQNKAELFCATAVFDF